MFHFSLEPLDIATQIAGLLNDYNDLSTPRYPKHILSGKTKYIVEVHGRWVLGCVGTDRQGFTFTEVKHLVVHPTWRGKKLAYMLAEKAIETADTKMVYATIREDNEPSLKLFKKLGFSNAGGYPNENHNVVLLARVTPRWLKVKPGLKSNWLKEFQER